MNLLVCIHEIFILAINVETESTQSRPINIVKKFLLPTNYYCFCTSIIERNNFKTQAVIDSFWIETQKLVLPHRNV